MIVVLACLGVFVELTVVAVCAWGTLAPIGCVDLLLFIIIPIGCVDLGVETAADAAGFRVAGSGVFGVVLRARGGVSIGIGAAFVALSTTRGVAVAVAVAVGVTVAVDVAVDVAGAGA